MNYFYNFNLKVPSSLGFAAIAALALGAIGGCNNDNDRNWDPVDPNAGIYPVPQTITPFVGESPRKIQFWDLTYSWVEDPDGGTGTCTAGNVQILGDEPQVTQTADTCPESLGQVAPCDPQAGDDDQGNNVVASGAVQQSVNGCFKDEQGVANCSATLVSGPTDELTCQQAVEREDPLGAGAIWYQSVADSGPGTSENSWWGKAPGAPGGEVSVSGGTQLSFGGSSGAAISSSAADSETAISVALSGGREFSEQAQPIYLCNSPTADVTSTDACALSSLFSSCLNDGQNCKIDNITGDTDGVFNVYLKSPPVGAAPPVEPYGVISYLGQGYNTYTGNPYPTPIDEVWSDEGWTGIPVFLQDESTGGPALDVNIQKAVDAQLETTTKAIESSSQWATTNTSSFSVKGGVPDVGSSTGGASFSNASSQLNAGANVYYSNEYYQQMQTSTIAPSQASMPLSADFIDAVKNLPTSYSTASDNATSAAYEAYNYLLTFFGTAVAVEIAGGGRWVETFEFTGQAYGQAQSNSSSFSLGISAMDDGIKGSGSASSGSTTDSSATLAAFVTTTSLTLLGGSPGDTFDEWQASITNSTNLYPIGFNVWPLSDFAAFLGETAVNANFCSESPSCSDAISEALEGYGEWLTANACGSTSEVPSPIYPDCTTTPSTTVPDAFLPPPNAAPVLAADTKRSFSINFTPDYNSALSYCIQTDLSIVDGDITEGQTCDETFGPYGKTANCYFAMQSNSVGIRGSAVFQCYFTKDDTVPAPVTFEWDLAEDEPDSTWATASPPTSVTVDENTCVKQCNVTGSIVIVP